MITMKDSQLPFTEHDVLQNYNLICRIWEYVADGVVNAYIRKHMIKEIPKIDEILIGNMNQNNIITDMGDNDCVGFKIETEFFDTHLYFANINAKNKLLVSTTRPILASSNWRNIIVVDRKFFCLEVQEKELPLLVNFFGGFFAACMNCESGKVSRGARYLFREILANIFLASVTKKSAKELRKWSDPDGYFTDETNKLVVEYNSNILGIMESGKPFIPTMTPDGVLNDTIRNNSLNDLLIIMSLQEYQQLHTKKQNDEDEDYGDESDESSDSI